MGPITVGEENSTPIELYYEDHGRVEPQRSRGVLDTAIKR
jgi:hypothetical protein